VSDETTTFTCETHGTKTVSDFEFLADRCCADALHKALAWGAFCDYLDRAKASDDYCREQHEAGDEWYRDYRPATDEDLFRAAAEMKQRDDEEFDYGFNVLYYELHDC
jgi:hypothetical protein